MNKGTGFGETSNSSRGWKSFLLFALQLILAISVLGIAIDLVTAHVAVEYFTVHHPHVVDSESPVVMALVWGVGASWWVGALAAPMLWWANASRPQPLRPQRILRAARRAMIAIWLLMMGIVVGVYLTAGLIPESKRRATFESDRKLIAVAMAHSTEYVLGGIMTVVLLIRIRTLTPER